MFVTMAVRMAVTAIVIRHFLAGRAQGADFGFVRGEGVSGFCNPFGQ